METRWLGRRYRHGGKIQSWFKSMPGDTYWLDATTHLRAWQPLTSITATNNLFTFVDTNAWLYPVRSYRTRH